MVKKRPWYIGALSLWTLCVAVLAGASEATAARYKVTLTNLTRGQYLSPFYVAAHQPGLKVFALGSKPSAELEALAEGADVGPLADLLKSSSLLLTHSFGSTVIPPGRSASVEIDTFGAFDRLSLVSSLTPTNDGFIGINQVPVPTGDAPRAHFLDAYDAGTEANDELCSHITGPAGVCAGEGFNASRDGAEGRVLVHAGIHGIGDLVAADRDWRNPVARVTIRRILP